ncbi:MAG TPA: DUF512 domain-containing protein [Tepidiformaceae bacterium]|nr:DUF512 domain-containing protein [Tepidiformaceae bacterium]
MNRPPAPGLISAVVPGSLAEEAGIEAGDSVVSVDGRVLRDVVDFQFYATGHEVQVAIRKANGLDDLVLFEKEIDEDLGIEFERATWDEVTLCNNNCFFCFLKGLPKGMRKSLYTKDDDYRLSFLHGNFVTLTNLTEDDWDRLEEQRLSPLNVSVHATELTLRRHMLSNKTAPDVIEQLKRLKSLGLQAHTQIVLCPGVNDGEHLARSIRELGELYPTVLTVSVVPVGASPKLEEWSLKRDGIPLVRPTPEYARAVLKVITPFQKEFRRRFGATVAQCSDEFYVTAGTPIPGRITYDGFPQYENGIGMVRTMLDDWNRTKRRIPAGAFAGKRAVIGTAALIAPLLSRVAAEASEVTGADIRVRGVTNTVFGERVNVSGLICGSDYVQQVDPDGADVVILPRPSLDYFGEKFLDSMYVPEAEAAFGRPLGFAAVWSDVIDILRDGPKPPQRNDASNGAMWSQPA